MTKPALHYQDPPARATWSPVERSPGVTVTVLATDADSGAFTRLLSMAPGCDTVPGGVQRHEGPEQALLVDGEFTDLSLGLTFGAGSYACRPEGMAHGPWRSTPGCTILEVHDRRVAFDRAAMEYHDPLAVPDPPWEPLGDRAAQLVLSADASNGALTRLLRFDPGYDGSWESAQVHDFTEEVFLLQGTVHDVARGVTSCAGAYACRPVGMSHGPWRSPEGCLVYELRGPRPQDIGRPGPAQDPTAAGSRR